MLCEHHAREILLKIHFKYGVRVRLYVEVIKM